MDLERREPVQLQCVTCHGFGQEFQAGLNGLGGLDRWACRQCTCQMALLASMLLMTGQRTMQAEVGSSIPAGAGSLQCPGKFFSSGGAAAT